jgi:hypothetical protein
MRIICVALTGLVALAAVSAQAAPNPNQQNWHPLGPAVTFELGDQACGKVGIRLSGVTGAAIGGGVRAFKPGDLFPIGRRHDGLDRLRRLGSGLLSSVARRQAEP